MGAQELRNGTLPPTVGSLSPDVLQALDTGMFFDLMGYDWTPPRQKASTW
ncbi:hypothetical protein UMZ34_12195 [Halopseudomonas pachastrellae]|nr:hypothetical protein UMZ34_12195 [Halopseudomonas pachastrellae]